MADEKVSLAFVLDEAAQKRVETRVSTLAQELEKLGVTMEHIKGAKFGEAVVEDAKKAAEAIKQTTSAAQEAVQAAQAQRLTWTQFVKQNMGPEMQAAMKEGLGHAEAHKVAINKIAAAWKQYKAEGVTALKTVQTEADKTTQTTQDVIRSAKAEASALRQEAAAMSSDLEQARIASLRNASSFIGGIGQSALLTGGAITGGIFLAAKNYIKDAEQSTVLTQRWAAATKEIAESQSRIGNVAARAVLPLLEQAADVAEKAAAFTEAHPEIVQAALNIGLFTAGFGALTLAVSKGIKLVADVKYLATIPIQIQAAQLQDRAAEKQLLAAQARLKELGIQTPGGKTPAAGGLGLVNTIGMIVAGLAASAAVVGLVDQILEQSKFGPARRNAIDRARDQGARIYPGILPPNERSLQAQLNRAQQQGNTQEIERVRGELDKLGNQANVTADDLNRAVTGLAGSKNEAAIVSAFEQWQKEDARIVQEAAARRLEIVRSSERQIAQATAQFTSRVAAINSGAAKRAESITSNFLKSNAEAEARYQEQRAQIIRDGGKQIREIEEAHQERVRKMTMEHDDRVADLTASRDALGLVKEQRRFNREKAEEERSTRQEIAKRRADLAERLADLDRQNQAERAQRLIQFQEALAENEAQRKEELKQAAAAHAEELQQIRDQRNQQLQELNEGLNAERLRRREVFLEEIRDLDASLLGERALRNQRYAEMLADVDKFLADERAKRASGLTAVAGTAGRASGGYASGIVRTGEMGVEYVLSNRTTRAAEQIIGGRLTQDAILGALANGTGRTGGQNTTIHLTDARRFDRMPASWEREQMNQEILTTLEGLLK